MMSYEQTLYPDYDGPAMRHVSGWCKGRKCAVCKKKKLVRVVKKLMAVERCEDCGQVLRIGAWPFCASPSNPQGHARGCYGWHFGGSAA